MTPWSLPFAAAALAAALGGCADAPATQAGACRVERVAELGARLVDGQLVVPVQLDGQSAEFLVDTASGASLITPEAAQRLGLQRDPRRSTLIHGAGGNVVSADAQVRRFAVGSVVFAGRSITVGSVPTPANTHVDGLLGADVLGRFEIDLDVPQSRLGLWRAEGCGTNFDPMEGPHFALPLLRATSGHVLIPVRLDGARMLAVVDSAAVVTVATTAAATFTGVALAALAQEPGGTALGADLHRLAFHQHRFAEFEIGPEHYHPITLAVGDVQVAVAGMLLGADYLAHHRVWISRVVPRVFIAPVR